MATFCFKYLKKGFCLIFLYRVIKLEIDQATVFDHRDTKLPKKIKHGYINFCLQKMRVHMIKVIVATKDAIGYLYGLI